MNINSDSSGRPQGVVAQIIAVAVGALALAVAFAFGIVIFAVVAVAGVIFWCYLWWKTRQLRRAMREQGFQPGAPVFESEADGSVIDGEAVRVVEVERIETMQEAKQASNETR